eukprot:jgi/Mesvir1/15382/Mv26328-RA.1
MSPSGPGRSIFFLGYRGLACNLLPPHPSSLMVERSLVSKSPHDAELLFATSDLGKCVAPLAFGGEVSV